MTLTRPMLKAMGIEEEKIDQIIEQHAETVEALKKQRDSFKEAAEKVPSLEQKIQELEAAANDGYREKYDAEHQQFEDYNAAIEKERANEKRKSIYRQLLTDAGISGKRVDTVLRVTDLDSLQFDDEGNLANADDLKAKISEEWSDLIPAEATRGANVETPPAGTSGGMTKDQILAIKNPVQRQAAMAENPALFGLD